MNDFNRAVDWILSHTASRRLERRICFVPCWKAGSCRKVRLQYFGDGNAADFWPMTAGVQIAGIDLGFRHASWFQRLGMPDALLAKLAPFLGLRGLQARDALAKAGRTILSEGEMKALLKAYAKGMLEECRKAVTTLDSMPDEAQTALLSFAVDCGTSVLSTRPDLLEALQKRRFIEAGEILKEGSSSWGLDWMHLYEEGVLLDRAGR